MARTRNVSQALSASTLSLRVQKFMVEWFSEKRPHALNMTEAQEVVQLAFWRSFMQAKTPLADHEVVAAIQRAYGEYRRHQ